MFRTKEKANQVFIAKIITKRPMCPRFLGCFYLFVTNMSWIFRLTVVFMRFIEVPITLKLENKNRFPIWFYPRYIWYQLRLLTKVKWRKNEVFPLRIYKQGWNRELPDKPRVISTRHRLRIDYRMMAMMMMVVMVMMILIPSHRLCTDCSTFHKRCFFLSNCGNVLNS